METILDYKEAIIEEANKLRWELGENIHDMLMENIYENAAEKTKHTIKYPDKEIAFSFDRALDKILTSKYFGFPIMFIMLGIVFWLTIEGANYPSVLLSSLLVDTIHPALKSFAVNINLPWWLSGVLIDGAYLAMAWVVSVMFPPMAIFFPLYTLLEDFGYLPRVAFNMDSLYKKVGAHGKQALTMAMGFGFNAAGVIATRVIDSPSLQAGGWTLLTEINLMLFSLLHNPYSQRSLPFTKKQKAGNGLWSLHSYPFQLV